MNLDTGAALSSLRLPTHTIISLHGELDMATTAELREQILAILDGASSPLIIDLSRVTFCDAAGLAMLVGVKRRARPAAIRTCLAGPDPQVTRLLQLTGLHRAFTIYPNLTAALRDLPTGKAERTRIPTLV